MLVEGFRHANFRVRWLSAVALARVGKPAIPALHAAYESGSTRKLAVYTLRLAEREARPCVPLFLESLASPDREVRLWSGDALASIRPQSMEVLLSLSRRFDVEEDESVRQAVGRAVLSVATGLRKPCAQKAPDGSISAAE